MRFKEFLNEEVKKPTREEVLAEFDRMKKTFDPDTTIELMILPADSFIRTQVYWHSRTKEFIFPVVRLTRTKDEGRSISTHNFPFLWKSKTGEVENLLVSKAVDRKLMHHGDALAQMTDDSELKKKIYAQAGDWYEIQL